ncbi:MAG TPA: M36 family metallopeptidase, partial [Nannocystis sp.]
YHLERLAGLYGAGRAAVRGARLVHVHDTGRGGIVVVLRPTVAGVDVMGGDVKVLLDRRLGLRALSGSLHPAARPDSARPFTLPAPAAIAAALRDLYGLDVPADRWKPAREFERAGSRYYELAEAVPELRLDRPARVRPVYYPVGGKLVPAHRIELQTTYGERRQGDAWLYVIAADDGRVLVRRDNVQRDAFTYRVWADADGDRRPLDGPLADYTPHPLGEPMGTPGPGAAPVLVTMEGFNTNPDGLADPWLPPGATETIGNNVDAYCNPTSAPSYGGADFRATVTAPGVFDRVYDLGKEPFASPEQGMASATQLFYTTNWLHDWWYDSGFNESAGNAQMDNFGRGGVGGDPLLALAQDNLYNGLYDNAYMVTPEDGESPEMHMLLWSVEAVDVKLTVGPMNQALMAGQAKFGPKTYDVTAEVVLVDDGAGKSPSDGCEPPANDLTGKIALIDSGTCAHEIKTTRAEEAGALAVIIANSVPNQAPPSPGQDWDIVDPTIPTVGVTKEDGDALKALLENATVTAHMVGNTPPMRDGTLDNLVVAHEWGHYLHLRLVECLNLQCYAQSEGWGDFLALHLALREGDDLHGTYSEANYGGFDPTYYFGGRRQPYSVDFDRNALTFRHISDGEKLPDHYPTNDWGFPNSEPHNAGEVWATMLWEVYVAMHEAGAGRKSFAEIRRAMSDYVVGGMLLAPPAPTYVEQRDAILAVMAEQDPVDFAAAAAAFARRGAGTCAIAPPRHSVTLEGVVED